MDPNLSVQPDCGGVTSALLPLPKNIRVLGGACDLRAPITLDVRAADARLVRAAGALVRQVGSAEPRNAGLADRRSLTILVAVEGADSEDAYTLRIRPERIEIVGGGAAGAYFGLQTLSQLVRLSGIASRAFGGRSSNPTLPCCEIIDSPDFKTRGLLYDVTRGRVPTLDTLNRLVDRMTALKINQLQLYIEHAFVFSFDAEICGPNDGLTPNEIRELDVYCKERFIDLVPAMATLGHMGRILSMPGYRHLAEIEATTVWEDMAWPQRMRGFTLDVMNPEAHRLVERMWGDVLDAFSSPVVNICGDEPWDLGKGKNRDRFGERGCGEAYLTQIRRTHEICAKRGRRTQFWSDVVSHYRELFRLVPRGSSVLHWGYDDRADYEGTRQFVEAGLDTIVCPGTSGWKRLLNPLDAAQRNIATFAREGKRWGATGLLNTDWGDHGHFNPPASSWHGIAVGAAAAWSADHHAGASFDGTFSKLFFECSDSAWVEDLRIASRGAERCETWRLFWQPLSQIAADQTLPTVEEAGAAAKHAQAARRWLKEMSILDEWARGDAHELDLACRFTELFVLKVRLAHEARVGPDRPVASRVDRRARSEWAELLDEVTGDYARAWRLRYKESGLLDIVMALQRAGEEVRRSTTAHVSNRFLASQSEPRP